MSGGAALSADLRRRHAQALGQVHEIRRIIDALPIDDDSRHAKYQHELTAAEADAARVAALLGTQVRA